MTAPHRPLEEDLDLAADELEKTAIAIRESNAVGDRQWVAPPEYAEDMARDRAEHDELLRLAVVLRRHAKYLKPNPLGGPAKVFDAMADRLRAGEAWADVLRDYGFEEVRK